MFLSNIGYHPSRRPFGMLWYEAKAWKRHQREGGYLPGLTEWAMSGQDWQLRLWQRSSQVKMIIRLPIKMEIKESSLPLSLVHIPEAPSIFLPRRRGPHIRSRLRIRPARRLLSSLFLRALLRPHRRPQFGANTTKRPSLTNDIHPSLGCGLMELPEAGHAVRLLAQVNLLLLIIS